MIHRLLPQIGQWYQSADRDVLFQVVAVDEPSGTIEIQDFEGSLDELDRDEWLQLELEEAEPPEDWTGPLDDVEADDLGYTDSGTAEGSGSLPEETAGAWRDLLTGGDGVAEESPTHRPTLRPARRARRPPQR